MPLLPSEADAHEQELAEEPLEVGLTTTDVLAAEADLRRIAAGHFANPQLREAFVLRGLAALNTVRVNRNRLTFPSNPAT